MVELEGASLRQVSYLAGQPLQSRFLEHGGPEGAPCTGPAMRKGCQAWGWGHMNVTHALVSGPACDLHGIPLSFERE